jgi:glycosyltransferase involved in cell wall biosynthesis
VKIWYDVSDLVSWSARHLTGIQRTSVGILNGLGELGVDVRLVRFDVSAGRFVPLEASALPEAIRRHLRFVSGASAAPAAPPAAVPPAAVAPPRKRTRKRLAARVFGTDRHAEEVRSAFRQFKQAARLLRASVGAWASSRLAPKPAAGELTSAPLSMRRPVPVVDTSPEATAFAAPGDAIVSVGATWCLPGHAEAAAVARSRGVLVARMIYDLIPTIKPQWLEPVHTQAITLWVREVLTGSDRVLTISEYSRREIEQYCAECRFDLPSLAVVRLGDVLETTASGRGPAALPKFVPSRPFFLCVSTLDVRKNHRLLYDAWTQLAARRGDACPDLVCIGMPHLHVTDLLRELRQDRAVNRRIHVLHGVEDFELDWYYKNCAATIYPSKYEGWGLPVAESLGHGRLCLASHATSIPEISDLPEFFDPFDVHGVAGLVERVLDEPAWVQDREERIRAEFQPTDWRETAAQVLAALEEPAVQPRLAVWPQPADDAEGAADQAARQKTLRAA